MKPKKNNQRKAIIQDNRRFSYAKIVTSKNEKGMQTKLFKLLLTVISDESLITSLAKMSLLAHMRQLLHSVFST